MSISKNILLSLLVSTSIFAEKTVIHRDATKYEIALADVAAIKKIEDFCKPTIQKFGENLAKNMNYLNNAQPFGVERGLVKAVLAVVGMMVFCKFVHMYQDFKSVRSSEKSE